MSWFSKRQILWKVCALLPRLHGHTMRLWEEGGSNRASWGTLQLSCCGKLSGHSVSDLHDCALGRVTSRHKCVQSSREHFYIQKMDTYRSRPNKESKESHWDYPSESYTRQWYIYLWPGPDVPGHGKSFGTLIVTCVNMGQFGPEIYHSDLYKIVSSTS